MSRLRYRSLDTPVGGTQVALLAAHLLSLGRMHLLCCSIVSRIGRDCMSRFVDMSWLCAPSCQVTCHILSTTICPAMSLYSHPVRFSYSFALQQQICMIPLDRTQQSIYLFIFGPEDRKRIFKRASFQSESREHLLCYRILNFEELIRLH